MNVMATNKQTMDVIAMGLVPGKAKAEEREDVICPVIEQIAQRAAEDFTDMAIELDMQGTLEMVNYLEAAQSFGSGREVVTLMKCIFLASGRKEAAKTLELLDFCYKEDELAYEYFTECFLTTDEMDLFIIENIMMSGHADSDTSENGGGHEM